MKAKTFLVPVGVALAAGLMALLTVPAQAATVPGAPWAELAPEGVTPRVLPVQIPNLLGRPSVLVETDYYVYGPGTGFATPELHVSLDSRQFNDAVTLFLYWQDRSNPNNVLFFNLRSGWTANEVDMFAPPGQSPTRVVAPELDDFVLFGNGGAFGALNGVPQSTGQYQFVLEVRDGNGQGVVAIGNAMYNHVDGLVQVSGNMGSANWTANNVYYLATPVNVQGGGTLTIQAGTIVLASEAGQGTLVIRQNAQINADGTAMKPIIFTTEVAVGQRGPGLWGGLVLNGNAPTNQQNPTGEGNSGPYGGNNPSDSSGVLRYVRIEFAGIRFSTQNELNGIALQGVGNGTVVEHVQVHFNQDDGIEFFGGTVNAKYILVTGAEDDSFDWTFGWNGTLQFFVAVQYGQEADKCIEADNFQDNNDATPRSNPTLSHGYCIKLINSGDTAMHLKVGTAGTIANVIVIGYDDATNGPVWVDGAVSQGLVGTQLFVNNSIFFDNDGPAPLPGLGTNIFDNPRLGALSLPVPDLATRNGSPARNAAIAVPGTDGFPNIGGIDPNDNFMFEGWVTYADN